MSGEGSMMKLVCLANSRKNSNRCIAGMDNRGVWFRPVSDLEDGSITFPMRQIDGGEPELLDILCIPLTEKCPDHGHQPENRLIGRGPWKRIGKLAKDKLIKFCERRDVLLHNVSDRVPVSYIRELHMTERYSLQLIHVRDARFFMAKSFKGNPQCRSSFSYDDNRYDLVVTDPAAEMKISQKAPLKRECVLTVSMGGPYEEEYFKFVAAVIEIPD
jgi:hypothetical protein